MPCGRSWTTTGRAAGRERRRSLVANTQPKGSFATGFPLRLIMAARGGSSGETSRRDKSLGLLTTKFVQLLQESPDGILDLKVVCAPALCGGHVVHPALP